MSPARQPTRGNPTQAAIQALESLERSGVRQLGKPRRRSDATPAAAIPAIDSPVPASGTVAPVAKAGARATAPAGAEIDTLDRIRHQVAACTRCDELCSTRMQTVFGVGNPHARLCFLGEAPGADEDRQGEPFVGRAGQLLTKIIEACTLSRSDVYILNVLKCQPPGNRTPLPHEVANCREYLDRQLALIRPEYICCLGTVAAQTLLSSQESISRMRGKSYEYNGIPVTCTYHPAYLLRNPSAKKDVWEDMKVLLRKMGIELDPASSGK